MIYTVTLNSPLGLLTLATDGERITGLWMEGQAYFGKGIPLNAGDGKGMPVIQQAAQWLEDYFSCKHPSPTQLPLSPAGTGFQKTVWALLCQIPYGQTVSYGDLAKMISAQTGRKTSARAVGSAVGRNPISILIPCHRVVGADGKLTGYAGGIPRKEFLLQLEKQAKALDNPVFQK